MKFDATVASLLLALVCAVSGWVVWWVNRLQFDKELSNHKAAETAKKEYAAQRDFEHLKGNLKQMSDGIVDGFDEMENRFDGIDKELLRIEAYLIHPKPSDRG
ncbi:hypothetical protein [Nostoc sp.]|uniref:hypothetical protein n=1 Tax=Nostoc sp. TaxID=1180 RepID=UPI002FF9F169